MTKEPIPVAPPQRPLDAISQAANLWARRLRVQSGRLQDLLRAARSPEGRRQQVLPLLAVCLAVGAAVGLALGWHSQRRR